MVYHNIDHEVRMDDSRMLKQIIHSELKDGKRQWLDKRRIC
jgi:hypothetical protein